MTESERTGVIAGRGDEGSGRDAVALAADIRDGRTTAREAVESCIERIEVLNGSINAVVYVEAGNARREADRRDREGRAGRRLGPLHGVPVTVKECFDWAGRPTTWGDPARAGLCAARDSVVVARLRGAGAVLLGKTNLPAYLGDWETCNPLFGPTRNPFEERRSAGGSSGGSAAAVASGMSFADVGSDMGGSIRLPAHYCGVFGLKPSWGLISMRGHSPRGEVREPDIGVAGPIARSARDASRILCALAGPADPAAPWTVRLPDPVPRSPGDLRIAAFLEDERCPVDAPYRERLQRFCRQLERAGARVEPKARPDADLSRQTELMNLLVRAETSTRPALPRRLEAGGSTRVRACRDAAALHGAGARMSHREWLALQEERRAVARAWDRFFCRYDLLACPAGACTAPLLERADGAPDRTVPVDGERRPVLEQHFWFGLASLPGLPAMVLPLPREGGELPAGVQLISARYSDLQLCDTAARLYRLTTQAE